MIEILAPAGDLISLKSAIASDTDAVYLGLSAFNARIKAENFTTENIKDTVDYCHLFGVKVYVTINIAVKESEKEELKKLSSRADRRTSTLSLSRICWRLNLQKNLRRKSACTRPLNSAYATRKARNLPKVWGFHAWFCRARLQSKKSKNQSRNKLGNRVFRARRTVRCVFREMSYVVVH